MDPNSEDKKNQARNLYFQTGLTQDQIAIIIGVSQKTISLWINENKWKLLKERTGQSPTIFIEHMVSELQELNANIAARPVGSRFPNREEAEVRRKILLSIKTHQEHQAAGVHAEVMTNFIDFVVKQNMQHGQLLVQYADKYLKGEKDFAPEEQYKQYVLPGDITPPAASAPDITPGNINSGDESIDKAAA